MKWFRLYTDVIHDPKVQKLPPQLFKDWINVLCLAAQYEGKIPAVIDDVAFSLRLSAPRTKKLLADLSESGLLDVSETEITPHNWENRQYKSDVSTERVKRFRQAKRNGDETVSETPPDTEQIQNRADTETEQNRSAAAPPGKRGRSRDQTALENISGFLHDFYHGERGKPDLGIVRKVHDALGDPVTEDMILEYAQFIQNKRIAGVFPNSWGLFLNWARLVREEVENRPKGKAS